MASTFCQKLLSKTRFFVEKLKISCSLDHTILFKFHRHMVQTFFKVIGSHCIFIPKESTGNCSCFGVDESPYFSHYNPKISASNSLYFRSCSRKCTCFRYTNFDFHMYFHNSLIPSVIYVFLLQERK